MKAPGCSLIVSTYNSPQALNLCLKSVQRQVTLPEEVIIADDGSSEETSDLIDKFRRTFSVPVKHVWHEDRGFRKTIILNQALISSSHEYIIQIDGDQILHRKFIADHLKFAKPGTFVRASRSYMDEQLSALLLQQKSIGITFLKKGLSNKLSAIRIPMLWPLFEYRYKAKETIEIHGSNMAYWRQDAIKVNGYNEDFKGWGPEDKEFIVRLMNAGLRKRFLKQGAIAYHIHHPENSRSNLSNNESLLWESIKQKKTFCDKGINQYL